jgi:hypothetical protein
MRMSLSSGGLCCARNALIRARSAGAVSRDCMILTCAICGPASTVCQPVSQVSSDRVKPVSSATSRQTLKSRSTVSPRTSLGSGVPEGK